MKANIATKILGFSLWVALVGAVLYAIYNQDALFEKQSGKVAKIVSKSGDIMYREEGLVRWRDAVDNQEFSDGDWVATGPDSVSTIGFKSGQVLKLGPDTQIQIRGILLGSNDYSYMVTLSRGAVIAEVKKENRQQLQDSYKKSVFGVFRGSARDTRELAKDSNALAGMVVRSGSRSFSIDEGKKIGLIKDLGVKKMERVDDTRFLASQFDKTKIASVHGLKPDFLPPIARVFPDKVGSIVVAQDAVFSKMENSHGIEAASLSTRIQNGGGEDAANPGDPSVKGRDQSRISLADLGVISGNVLSSQGNGSVGRLPLGKIDQQSGLVRESVQKIKDPSEKLPVLRLKEKIDRLEPNVVSRQESKRRGRDQSDLKEIHKRLPLRAAAMRSDIISKSNSNISLSKGKKSEDKAKNAPSAEGYEYFLGIDNRLLNISMYKSVSNLRNDKVKVPLFAPKIRPLAGELRPIIELVGRNGVKIPSIEGQSTDDSEILLPLDLLVRYGREKVTGVFKEYEVSARAGSILTFNGERSVSFERVFSVIRLKGYGESQSQGITVGLDPTAFGKDSKPNGRPKKDISPYTAPIRISVKSDNDLSRIMPFIQSANQVGMGKGGSSDDLGYFIVRKQAVVAEVSGSALSRDVLQRVTSALEGEFVFRGHKNALHESKDRSQRDLTTWIDSLLDQGKGLYVMKRSTLYPVSREFVKNNNEVARFIDSQAKAVFVEKVDVMVFR